MHQLARVLRVNRPKAKASSYDPDVWETVQQTPGTVTPASLSLRQMNQALGVTVTHVGVMPTGADVRVLDQIEVLDRGRVCERYVVRTLGGANTVLSAGLEAIL